MMALEHRVDEDALSRVKGSFDIKRVQSHRFFKELDLYRCDVDLELENLSIISPVTESFQRRTVQWMVYREKYSDVVKNDGSPFSGGILTDAVDMGKIAEILCCILENPAPPEFYRCQQIAFEDRIGDSEFAPESSLVPSTSNYVWTSDSSETNNSVLLGGTVSQRAIDYAFNKNAFRCARDETTPPPNSKSVMCVICGVDRRVRFEGKLFQNGTYLCEDCVTKSENNSLQCKATLIFVLHSTLTQWTDEVKRMANLGLKSFVYCGLLNCDCHVEPVCFNDYDIIITSYSHLQWNRDLVNSKMKLRNEEKYISSPSPLEFIKWWRICFDNYLQIECKTSKITLPLQCVHKWVMNVETSLADFYRVLKFLDISPFYDYKPFLWPIISKKIYMYSWFSNVISHNSLDDVNIELNIPKLTNEQHWLTYSPLEELLYLDGYNNYVNNIYVTDTSPCQPLNAQLKNVNWKKLSPIIKPIIQLLKECVHPQQEIGKFKKFKKMSMVEILNENISLWNNTITRTLNYIILQHNTIARFYFDMCPRDAIKYYSTVINLIKRYKNEEVTMDTFQVLHAIHNMNELLDAHPYIDLSTVSPELKMDLKRLIKEYNQCEDKMNEYICTMMDHNSNMKYLTNNKTLIADWYNDVFELTDIPQHFFYELQQKLADYCVYGVTDISDTLKSRDDVFNILQKWLTGLERRRTRVLKSFAEIQNLSFKELYNSSLKCCLLIKNMYILHTDMFNITKDRELCKLCESESYLKNYEETLYNFSYKRPSVNTYMKSQIELLLEMLFNYGKSKIKDEKWLKNATDHIEILRLLHIEFKDMHLLWCKLNDAIGKYHNSKLYNIKAINVSDVCKEKSSPNLHSLVEPESRVYGQPVIKCRVVKKKNDLNELLSDCKEYHNILINQIKASEYLENLKRKNLTDDIDTCDICLNNGDYGWAVLLCGHSTCANCVHKIREDMGKCSLIKCPFCAVSFIIQNSTIKYLENKQVNEELNKVPGFKYKGNFSIKIESITLKLMELIAENPNVKVLIFSFWNKALNLLGKALTQNAINHELLKPESDLQKTIEKFKTNSKTNALLMKLSSTFEDFSVTEATRIFFMEPIINKSYEIQAISKIHRIGQTQPTFVHHFIIRDTIEEKITDLFANKSLDNWDEVTVSEMAEVLKK